MGNICNRANKSGPRTRTVVPNHTVPEPVKHKYHPNKSFRTNQIRTRKYTLLTFLPKNLFEQFHRFANLYFILVVALNWVPQVQAFGKEIAMIPVVFVLAVTAIKDAFEDYRRYTSDKKINHTHCRQYSVKEKRYVKAEWQDLCVGDIVHLSCDEIIPADILLLKSSDAQGMCHLETSNLDGETNLKQRQIVSGIDYKGGEFAAEKFIHHVECDLPNAEIYKFHGFIKTESEDKISLNKNNLLLRGCTIKNTDYVEGLVLYAGHETKAMLNNRSPRYKRSKLERRINRDVIYCVMLLLLMCVSCAIASGLWLGKYEDSTTILFIPYESIEWYNPYFQGFVVFFTYVIIYQTVIPLALYVSVELVKLGQVYFITNDVNLYYEAVDKRMECRALNITEDLGQIEYIFSDKTGTLTENQMEFKTCTIGGTDYPHTPEFEDDMSDVGSKYSWGSRYSLASRASSVMVDLKLEPGLQNVVSNMSSRSLLSTSHDNSHSKQTKQIQDFFVLMAICNTVVVTTHAHTDVVMENLKLEPGLQREISSMCLRSLNSVNLDVSDNNTNSHRIQEFFLLMAICNTVVVTHHAHEDLMDESGSVHEPSLKNHRHHQSNENLDKYNRLTDTPPRRNHISLPDTPSVRKPTFPPLTNSGSLTRSNAETIKRGLTLPPISTITSNEFPSRFETSGASIGTPSEGSIASSSYLSDGSNKSRYEAESPDELALVRAACTYGCRLMKRTADIVKIWLPMEGEVEFEVKEILHFDSTRKRMSVIVKNPNNQEITLYTKGADSAVLSVLDKKYRDDPELHKMVKTTEDHINSYAMQGLRTLCMGKKVLSNAEYMSWRKRFKEADSSMENREEKVMALACEVEKDLELLGATGIEDKLQDGVPETIAKLRQAGIKVWVLTGDKQETAVQVAYSTHLFSEKHQLIYLNAPDMAHTKDLLEHHILQIEREDYPNTYRSGTSTAQARAREADPSRQEYALVIDGKTLAYALNEKLEDTFLKLTQKCTSVVCCRSTPIQKGSVVKLVRDKLVKLTLAIGDGANDVSMIHVADIGIGISGQEGMQAVMASDFAISRFMFLQRLLLVHGHWCYCRLARFSAFMFYKSLVSVFSMFWFQIFSGFSGSLQYDSLYTMLLHVVFTALPPILNGVLDKDLSAETLLRFPPIYKAGILDKQYTRATFFVVAIDALYQSIIIYFMTYLSYRCEAVGIWEFGTTQFVALILIILFTCAIDTHSWIWPQWLTTVLSFVFFWCFVITLHAIWFTFDHPANPYWVMQNTLTKPIHLLTVVLSTSLALLPRFVIRILQRTAFPDDTVKAQLWEKRQSQISQESTPSRCSTPDTGGEISNDEGVTRSDEAEVRYRNGKVKNGNKTLAESVT